MKQKKCLICGKLFIPRSSRQQYCRSIILTSCPICGKEFERTCQKNNGGKLTCGNKDCETRYKLSNKTKNAVNKETKCKYCGKLFKPTKPSQLICEGPHFSTCIVCNSEFQVYPELTGISAIRKTCSDSCAAKLKSANLNSKSSKDKARATMLERYGSEYPSQIPEFKFKQHNTMLDRYGVKYYAQTADYKSKAIETNLDRYGVEWATQNEKVKDKQKETSLQRYGYSNIMNSPDILLSIRNAYKDNTGFDNPMQNPEVKDRIKGNNVEKYGVSSYSKTAEYKEKFKETSISRYGTLNPMQNPNVSNKVKSTCLDKYGVDCYLATSEARSKLKQFLNEKYNVDFYSQSKEWKASMMRDPSKVSMWLSFLNDPSAYLNAFDDKPSLKQLSIELGISETTVSYYVNYFGLQDKVHYTLSYMEDEVCSYITSLDPEIRIIRHNRQLISPYELDITLPDYNIAIECNPTATHNSSLPFKGNAVLPYNYHKMKTDKCNEKGWLLFHIFGYDWTHRNEIIKSMIANLLGQSADRIYARKCKIMLVSAKQSKEFLDANHKQGATNASIRLGLIDRDTEELVAHMTFNKMRSTIGKSNAPGCWELSRFCCKLNCNVVGGASKLFSYFVRYIKPEAIISFSDRAHNSGNMYRLLGFSMARMSGPNYVWVDAKTDVAYHRINAQKRNIKKFLKDDGIDLTKTEKQIMTEHGYVQVFDSGTITWEWHNSR